MPCQSVCNKVATLFLFSKSARCQRNTPLWRAVMASQGKGGAITLLLDAGANSHKKNNSGISSYHLAKEITN